MSLKQKLTLIFSCIFYVLTVYGFFHFSPMLVVVLFLLHSASLIFFSYMCYQAHNDLETEEHMQQEIGMLRAEKLAAETKMDEERIKSEKKLVSMRDRLEETEKELEETRKELEELRAEMDSDEAQHRGHEGDLEGLLPPEDEESSSADIIGVARTAIAELSAEARAHNLAIRISSASEKIMVRAGQKRILILFRNIIDNSIKYMQKEGSLVITISAIEDDIFIVLKDTGNGLAEEETKHVFELNYQGSNRLSGNGLGLAQARAIVEHYGGTIYARSTAGGGFAIYIQIPASVEVQG